MLYERHRDEAEPGVTSLPPDRQRPGDRFVVVFRPRLFRPLAPRVACFLLVRFLSPDGARSATALDPPTRKRLMTDVFHEIPSNPAPEKATGGYFAGFDGK